MFISTGVSLLGAQAAGGGGLPDVYTTGLQAWWDFGEPTSYPGTGTTIFDLSGNGNDGTLSAGMAFTSSFGGGGYMANKPDKVFNTSNFLASTKNWTICVIGNYNGTFDERIWSGIMNGDSGDLAVSTTGRTRLVGSGGSQGYWNNVGVGSFDQDILNMYTYQCDNRNPFLRSYWKNKTSYAVVNATSAATSQIEAVKGFTWGGYNNPPATNSVTGISYVALVYNTNLIQANIDQNYDAYKVRFGLP